jgi:hypothetical protein
LTTNGVSKPVSDAALKRAFAVKGAFVKEEKLFLPQLEIPTSETEPEKSTPAEHHSQSE